MGLKFLLFDWVKDVNFSLKVSNCLDVGLLTRGILLSSSKQSTKEAFLQAPCLTSSQIESVEGLPMEHCLVVLKLIGEEASVVLLWRDVW